MKTTITRLIFTLFLLCANTCLFSSETELENELKLKIEFTRLMYSASIDISQDLTVKDLEENNPQIRTILKNTLEKYHHFFETKLEIPSDKKNIFKKMLTGLSYEKIISLIKKTTLHIEVIFKRKGIGLGIAMVAGILSEYLVPIILVNIGLAKLIPLSMMTPWTLIYSIIPNKINKFLINKELEDILGGKNNVKAYFAQQKEVLKKLNLKNSSEYLAPIKSNSDNIILNLKLESKPLWKKLLSKFGAFNNGLELESILSFIKEENLNSSYIDYLLNSETIEDNSKKILLVNHIFSVDNLEIENKFISKFHSHLVLVHSSKNYDAHWKWANEMLKKKTIEDVIKGIDQTPKTMTAKELALIWDEILIPEYLKYLDLSFFEAREMIKEFEIVKAKLILLNENQIVEAKTQEVYTFLKKIVSGKSFKGCKNTPSKILNYLKT